MARLGVSANVFTKCVFFATCCEPGVLRDIANCANVLRMRIADVGFECMPIEHVQHTLNILLPMSAGYYGDVARTHFDFPPEMVLDLDGFWLQPDVPNGCRSCGS